MSHRCKDLILKGENDLTHGGGYVNRRVALIVRLYSSLILRKTRHTFPSYRLRDGDILVTGDANLQDIGIPLNGKIIETPGHTVDSIFILFADGDCLAGDAAANMLQFAGAKYCVVFITDFGAYYGSWEKIIAAGASRIFPAHGAHFAVDKLKGNLWKNKAEDMAPYP